MLEMQLLGNINVSHPAQDQGDQLQRRNTIMPTTKVIKPIDTDSLRSKLSLNSMDMSIEKQILSIIEANDASTSAAGSQGINMVTQEKEFSNLFQ